MANKYRSVLASGGGVQPTGNAQPADVLSGKTFSNADGIDKAGTMVNNGAVSGTATPSQPYTIPAGYHNGNGIVNALSSAPIGNNKYIRVSLNDFSLNNYTVGTEFGDTNLNTQIEYIIDVSDKTGYEAVLGTQFRYKSGLKKDGTFVSAGLSSPINLDDYKILIVQLWATSAVSDKIVIRQRS